MHTHHTLILLAKEERVFGLEMFLELFDLTCFPADEGIQVWDVGQLPPNKDNLQFNCTIDWTQTAEG